MTKHYLSKAQHFLGRVYDIQSKGPNWVAAGALLLIMFLVTADVIMRACFKQPITGTYEITQFVMIFAVFFAVGYTQVRKRHIAVTVVSDRFPKRVGAVLESITYILGLVLYALMAWRSILHGLKLWHAGQESLALRIPVGPFYIMVAVGCLLFCLVLLADFVNSLAKVRE